MMYSNFKEMKNNKIHSDLHELGPFWKKAINTIISWNQRDGNYKGEQFNL